jgi:hypothetical protein
MSVRSVIYNNIHSETMMCHVCGLKQVAPVDWPYAKCIRCGAYVYDERI